MMLYDALEEILPFPDCAKNTICNCFSGLQIHNNVTQGLQIPADRYSCVVPFTISVKLQIVKQTFKKSV